MSGLTRDRTHDDLVAAVNRNIASKKAFRRRLLVAGTAAVVVGCLGLFVLPGSVPSRDSHGKAPNASSYLGIDPSRGGPLGLESSQEAPFPSATKVSLDQALAQASFPVLTPHSPDANPENLKEIYVDSGIRELALEFPQPASQSTSDLAQVRQAYVEILEQSWVGGDPTEEYKSDIARNPDVGKTLCALSDGTPALCVEARSPSDAEQANPAYLRSVKDGVSFQISGGSSVATLVEIASSLEQVK